MWDKRGFEKSMSAAGGGVGEGRVPPVQCLQRVPIDAHLPRLLAGRVGTYELHRRWCRHVRLLLYGIPWLAESNSVVLRVPTYIWVDGRLPRCTKPRYFQAHYQVIG